LATAARVPTMRDVADRAGVSAMTVSRVLHGDRRVSVESRRAILDAVGALGYRRNEAARALRTGQSGDLVGLVITNLANPFYSQLAVGVERFTSAHSQHVLIGNSGEDPAREAQLLSEFIAQGVSGIIVVPSVGAFDALTPDRLNGLPVVLATTPAERGGMDSVVVDDSGGADALTSALIADGHARIGYIGFPTTSWTGRERLRGFRAALDRAGLGVQDDLVALTVPDARAAERAAFHLLNRSDPPTALLAANNRITLGTYRAIRRSGHHTPLAGFDDVEFADLLDHPLIVGAYDASDLGETAARMLHERASQQITPGTPARSTRVPVVLKRYNSSR